MRVKKLLTKFRRKDELSGTVDLTGQPSPNHLRDDDEEDEEVTYDDTSLYTSNKPTEGTDSSYDPDSYFRATTTTKEPMKESSPYVPHSSESASTPIHTNLPPDRYAETRNLVKKFIADIWNRGELELIPQVCSPSLRFNGNTGFDKVGHDGLARMVETIRNALDDYHCEIHSMVVEDNKCFCRLRFSGRHVGLMLGHAATNKTVSWMGATEFTCQNGKILKVWELGDVKSLEEQLAS